MFKRVMTILICVLSVVFLALLLSRLPRGRSGDVVSVFRPSPQEEETSAGTGHGIRVGAETEVVQGDLNISKFDADGRLTHTIQAQMRPEGTEGRARLTDPRIRFYGADGNQLTITAPHGWIDTEGVVVTDISNIRRGALTGGVIIRDDRSTPRDESDDLVVLMDRCQYEGRTLHFHTDDPIVVRGPEVEVDAIGMKLYLDPEDNSFKALHFERQIHMVIWRGGDRFRMDLTPTPSGAEVAAPSTDRSTGGAAVPEGQPTPPPEGRTPHRFTLTGNVRVKRSESGLEADRQVVLIAWLKGGVESRVRGGESAPPAEEAPAAEEPEPQPEEPARAPRDEVPVDVTCDGPFVFERIAPEGVPTDFHLTAAGDRVVLWDRQMRAKGNDFAYDGATGKGSLTSADKVDVALRDEAHISGRTVHFDREAGEVLFDGPGDLVAKVGGRGLGLAPAEPQPQDESKEPFVATWIEKMNVAFGEYQPVDAEGKPLRDDQGQKVTRNFLRRAEFHGQSVLRQGSQTLSGDYVRADLFPPVAGAEGDEQALEKVTARGRVAVRQPEAREGLQVGNMTCREMEFTFRQAEGGKSRPDRLTAAGQVVADYEKGGIEAEDLKLWFAPHEKDPSRDRVVKMIADGSVKARQQDIYAEADHMEGDERTGLMKLRGTAARWAMASEGPHRIRGELIEMKRAQGRVDVAGPGTLTLLSDRSLEGQKLDKPMPLDIAWTRKMWFERNKVKREAHFSGQVRTSTPDATVDCADLWVFFEETPEEPGPDAAAAQGEEKPAPGGELFRNLSLARVTALEDVVARTVDTPADPAKDVTVTTIIGPRLEYNAAERAAVVEGAGTMHIIEVARMPANVEPHKRTPRSTTNVTWKRKMIFNRTDLVAWFGEEVVAEVIGEPQNLAAAAGGGGVKLSGKSVLKCQVLRVYMQEGAAGQGPAGRAGVVLKEMVALSGPEPPWVTTRREVTFRDGDYFGSAERMTYDHERKLLVLTGSPARIEDQRQKGGKVEAEKMYFWRQTGRIDIIQPWTIEGRPDRGLNLGP